MLTTALPLVAFGLFAMQTTTAQLTQATLEELQRSVLTDTEEIRTRLD
jgi:hypothetical protein